MSNRFVILLHESPRGDHWDLMLETGTLENPRLTTWSLPPQQMPAQNISFICAGTQLPDHRIAYLDYEGPISDHRGQSNPGALHLPRL